MRVDPPPFGKEMFEEDGRTLTQDWWKFFQQWYTVAQLIPDYEGQGDLATLIIDEGDPFTVYSAGDYIIDEGDPTTENSPDDNIFDEGGP